MTSSASASGGNMAGGPSQLSSSASKVGGGGGAGGPEASAVSETNLVSLYGKVKASKELPSAGPPVSKSIVALRNKIQKWDFLCGLGGVVFSIAFSAACIVLGVFSFQGNVMFINVPNFGSLANKTLAHP
uniref:ADP,ATP carrier protein n=1 Tax=Caenorhabditis tropicalis TaxID=1561998 RepID=A0A1I7TVE6_9PELO